MDRSQHMTGKMVLGAAALLAATLAFLALSDTASAQTTRQTLGSRIRVCVQERRADGYFDHDLTRAERRAIRAEFRACVRAAINAHHGRSSSSSSSSMTSSSSTSSSSVSSTSSSRSSSSRSVLRKVEIEDFEFYPAVLNVKVGTTVRWKNEDEAPHTVTSNTGGVLNSGMLDENETYSHTFTASGTYNYHCNFHPNMTGAVVVTE
jgi:plastocyanin